MSLWGLFSFKPQQDYNPEEGPAPRNPLPLAVAPPEVPIASQNRTTNWGSSVQTHEWGRGRAFSIQVRASLLSVTLSAKEGKTAVAQQGGLQACGSRALSQLSTSLPRIHGCMHVFKNGGMGAQVISSPDHSLSPLSFNTLPSSFVKT